MSEKKGDARMVKPHPTCVMRKMVKENKSRKVAEEECIEEGKVHGISRLAEEYRRLIGEIGW